MRWKNLLADFTLGVIWGVALIITSLMIAFAIYSVQEYRAQHPRLDALPKHAVVCYDVCHGKVSEAWRWDCDCDGGHHDSDH